MVLTLTRKALLAVKDSAKEVGLDKMILDEIDAEIAAVRNGE